LGIRPAGCLSIFGQSYGIWALARDRSLILNESFLAREVSYRVDMKTVPLLLAAAAALWGSDLGRQQPLFIIERSTNANVVHYDANLAPNGELDRRQPVNAYWIMAARDGRREELSGFEKSRAYGFNIEPEADSHAYRLELVAQKNRAIRVYRNGDTVRAETTIDGRRAYLTRIFVNARKVLAVPTVHSIELFGIDPKTGQAVHETVNP
jgi:hypothetical protein